MKNLSIIITLLCLSSAAFAADCPSVDETIAKAKRGEATTLDVMEAMSCNTNSCAIRLAVAESRIDATVDQFEVGEVDKLAVADAAFAFVELKRACSK